MSFFVFKTCLIAVIFLRTTVDSTINKNLKHYEVLHTSQFTHQIVKRGVQESSHPFNKIKEISFQTLGKDFKLILSPQKKLLHSKFKAVVVDDEIDKEKPISIDHDNFYTGRVFGETESYASVHLDSGMMTAHIEIPEDTYHIEPYWRHFDDASEDDNRMIAYKGSSINFSWNQEDENGFMPKKVCDGIKENVTTTDENEEDDEEEEEEEEEVFKPKIRVKRSDAEYYTDHLRKTRCPLLLVADYRFFKEMGNGNSKTTVNYLISLIDRVHKIYEDTVWRDKVDQPGISGMGFIIKKIVVHRKATNVRDGEVHYNMLRSTWDVRNLLEVFSREYSHKDFCLAHLFTDIKFEGGILGLAYVGSPRRNSVGGICTPEYFKNGYTLYLNSGLSSSRNHYGQRVITREADLVTAHEFGHNWGSEHDPDMPECSPSASQGGSYLMYTYSVSGYDVNNKKFSPCSLRFIRKVLLAKSSRCFTEPEESFCGNLRVEGDEQCDAGLLGSEDRDNCCDENCKLRTGSVCSDKNSPCCYGCQYMSAKAKCRDANYATCEETAACTGKTEECPKSLYMKDGTPCVERGKCKEGKCIPYCETQGLQSCMCDTLEDACKRCCRMNLNSTCFAVHPKDLLPDGTPCLHGFCNKGTCEKTMQDVVERFWDIIEEINISTVLKFLKDNIVGTVLIVSILLWVPSSCLISYVDRKREEDEQEEWEWRRRDELIHPCDKRRFIYAKVPTNRGERGRPTPESGRTHSRAGQDQLELHSTITTRPTLHHSAM